MYFLLSSKPAYTKNREKLALNSATKSVIATKRFNIAAKVAAWGYKSNLGLFFFVIILVLRLIDDRPDLFIQVVAGLLQFFDGFLVHLVVRYFYHVNQP